MPDVIDDVGLPEDAPPVVMTGVGVRGGRTVKIMT
jgi:hypothetical protein